MQGCRQSTSLPWIIVDQRNGAQTPAVLVPHSSCEFPYTRYSDASSKHLIRHLCMTESPSMKDSWTEPHSNGLICDSEILRVRHMQDISAVEGAKAQIRKKVGPISDSFIRTVCMHAARPTPITVNWRADQRHTDHARNATVPKEISWCFVCCLLKQVWSPLFGIVLSNAFRSCHIFCLQGPCCNKMTAVSESEYSN